MNERILYVEDDLKLARLVSRFLVQHGYEVTHLPSAEGALDLLYFEAFDALLLDIGLPTIDGLAVCRQIRQRFHGQIVFMTARRSEVDEVEGLSAGADDYLVKPVAPEVLLARLQTRLKRGQQSAAIPQGKPTADSLVFGQLAIRRTARQAYLAGESLALTSGEFDLLVHLASHAGQPLSRETLFKLTKGFEYDGLNRSVDNQISRLRRKLGDDLEAPYKIKTIWGKGYLFVPDIWG